MAIHDGALLKSIKNKLAISQELRFEVEFDSDQKNVIISVDTFTLIDKKIFDATILELALKSDFFWIELIRDFYEIIEDTLIKLIKKHLELISKAYSHFKKKYWQAFSIPSSFDDNCDSDWLDEVSCQLFMIRIGNICKTISEIADCPKAEFLKKDISLAILLRSCILDSLHIQSWNKTPEYIRYLAAESFDTKKNLPKDLPVELLDNFERVKSYFNPNSKHYTWRTVLKDSDFLSEYEHLYSYYSKYDHFSMLPWLSNRSGKAKLDMAHRALNFIRLSMFAMLVYEDKIPSNEFSDILGVTMTETEESGIYILMSKQLNEFFTGSSPAT